jgi:competence protein ComEA
MKRILYVLVGVLAGFILAGSLVYVMRAPTGQPIALQPAPTKPPIAVDIAGAVTKPGLYEFQKGARIQDALDAAGGLLTSADSTPLNLAALLEDGQKLEIPYKEGQAPTEVTPGPDLPGGTPTPSSEDRININTASLEELDKLPGIGPATAQKIIDYRTSNGPFAKIEDIMNVSGIGPSTFEKLKDLITVQ